MKNIILPVLLFAFLVSCGQTQKPKEVLKKEKKQFCYYEYKNNYLDLDQLEYIDSMAASMITEVKRENYYVQHFTRLRDANRCVYKDLTFELKENRDITITDASGKLVKTISEPDKKTVTDLVSGNAEIFSISNGVVCSIRLSGEAGYRVNKYDETGKLMNSWKIAHTIYKKDGTTVESIPYIYFLAHTDREMVFSSIHYSKPKKTQVLNLNDGTLNTTEGTTGGIIVNPNDNTLAGLVYMNEDKKTGDVVMGNTKWSFPNEGNDDGCKTILKDSILVVALYHNIATGCSVNAYNAKTGKLLWKGDVKQLMVGHSKYYNVVHLTLFENKLILEGNEAYGDYLQVLDLHTGKNLFADMPKNK
ncbi:MAG: hypothetical protein V2A54_15085 [Bacteroidota bacterium]